MNRRLLYLLVAVLAIKALFLLLDPYPGMMFGDSSSYLLTALSKWIPPDRSFVYGYFLRRLVVRPHSLMPMIVAQAVLSGIASWLVAVCLVRFFRVRFVLAAALAVACAIEPLQLMFERFVLADSLSTSLFAILMFVVFSYLARPGLFRLIWIHIIAALLVSLRLSFVPLALAVSILAPLLSSTALPVLASTLRKDTRGIGRLVLVPLLVSVVLSQGLLWGYRSLYGNMIGKPGAYSYSDGSFTLAVVVPLLQATDFPATVDGAAIFNAVKYPLSDPAMRPVHHWMEGGLVDTVRIAVGNDDEANAVMRQTAMSAAWRDPVGVLRLAASLYADFFDLTELRDTIKIEQGQGHEVTAEEAERLKRAVQFDIADPHFDSLTKSWQAKMLLWYWFLLIFPLLYPVYLIVRRREIRAPHVMSALFALMFLMESVVLVERIATRYLICEAWLALVLVGAMFPAKIEAGPEWRQVAG